MNTSSEHRVASSEHGKRARLRCIFYSLLATHYSLLCLSLSGCKSFPVSAQKIVAAQAPGVATGAGATFTGPANSAAPSHQVAERTITFQPIPLPQPTIPVIQIPPGSPPSAQPSALQLSPFNPQLAAAPATLHERVETALGAHQDAAGIVKVASTMSSWGTVKWIGLLCVLGAVAGLLWSAGHDQGYPVVFWKIGGVGVFLLLAGDNPLWLLLLLIPFGFYLVQRLNLLRIP